jgi:hypothetical protein
MLGTVQTRTVSVWGHLQKVNVYQKSAMVWVAYADYMGEPIEEKGESEGAALKRWSEAARSKGG